LQRSGCFCQIHCYSTFRYVDYVSITYFICVMISMLIFLRGGRYSCCNGKYSGYTCRNHVYIGEGMIYIVDS
jgi:hypothetical protein